MKKYVQILLMVPLFFFSNEILGQQKNGMNEINKPSNKERLNSESKPVSTPAEIENTSQNKSENNQVRSSKNSSKKDGVKLPDDFPEYINTGKPEADQVDYVKRKKQWINENPERYKALFSQSEKKKETERKAPQKIESNH